MPSIQLKPLQCSDCGGCVPLGSQGESLECPYCSRAVSVPPDYLALRQAQEQRRREERGVAGLYQRLAAPPSWLMLSASASWVGWVMFLTALGLGGLAFGCVIALGELLRNWNGTGGPEGAMIIACVLGVMFVPVAWEYLLHAAAPHLGLDVADLLPPGGSQALFGAVLWLGLVGPTVMLTLAEQVVAMRTRLQGMLAARPPSTPGGPSVCRLCGAVLELPEGQSGVRCLYCGSDNLLTIPAELLSEVKQEGEQFHRQVTEAVECEREARGAGRLWAWHTLLGWLVLVPILYGLGLLTDLLMDDPRPRSWRPGGQAPEEVTLDRKESFRYLGLRRGERWSVQPGSGLEVRLQKRQLGPFYAPEWTWESVDGTTLVAPYQGSYRLRLRGEPGQTGALEWRVEGPQ